MDYLDKQLDALKTISRSIAITIGFIAGVCIYLVQRDVASLLGLLDPLSFKPQIGYAGIKLVYATMTVMWPACLGVVFLLLRTLVSKRDAVIGVLTTDTPLYTVVASDPLCFSRNEGKPLFALNWFLRLLPPFAMIVGFLSFSYAAFEKHRIVLQWPAYENRGFVPWTGVAVCCK